MQIPATPPLQSVSVELPQRLAALAQRLCEEFDDLPVESVMAAIVRSRAELADPSSPIPATADGVYLRARLHLAGLADEER